MSTILQEALNEIVYIVRFLSSLKGKKYFVYGPTAQRTEDKNELWTIIKNDSEVYARLVANTDLSESEIERRVLKLLQNVPSVEEDVELSEDAVTGEPENSKTTGSSRLTSSIEDNNDADESTDESEGELKRKTAKTKSRKEFCEKTDMKIQIVRVENFDRKEKVEDCKAFLTKFNKVIGVERIVGQRKLYRPYDVAFEDEESANEFFKIKKIRFEERLLRRKLHIVRRAILVSGVCISM